MKSPTGRLPKPLFPHPSYVRSGKMGDFVHADFSAIETRLMGHLHGAIMKNFDYQSLAARTCPAAEQHRPDLVPLLAFRSRYDEAREAAIGLDAYKRALAYGKPTVFGDSEEPIKVEDPKVLILLHMVLGIITEAGELLEALDGVIFNGDALDEVNLQEEFGDINWYRVNALRVLGQTIDENDRQNIAKLLARFPDKFDANLALDRDLDAERAVLEGPKVMTLKDAEVIDHGGELVLRGRIFNDRRGQFTDGDVVITSPVQQAIREDRTVQTMYSVYYIDENTDFDNLVAQVRNRRTPGDLDRFNPSERATVDATRDGRVDGEIRIMDAVIYEYGPGHDRVRGTGVLGDHLQTGKIKLQPFIAGEDDYDGKYTGMLLVTDEVHLYRIIGPLTDERSA